MAFQKGQSGNPGGRPKENNEVKELARQHGPEAIERLVYWMKSDNAKASVSACNVLLDRGYGKAPQAITGEDGGSIDVTVRSGCSEEIRGIVSALTAGRASSSLGETKVDSESKT
jgi:hypothetical protein